MPLTNLDNVKSWLNITTSSDDLLLASLINQISLAILNYIQRPSLQRTTYNEVQSGVGNSRLLLRNWPVVSVDSLQVDTTIIPAAAAQLQSGYRLETWDGTSAGLPQALSLYNYQYNRGFSNIAITYQAGYCNIGESYVIPITSPYTITINSAKGLWTQDDGVTYANKIAFVKVANNPAKGQYSVTDGVYTFSSQDANADILISYSYTPADITQICNEWIGERYRYRTRIGEAARSMAGAVTASYNLKMPEYITMVLRPYCKVLPL